MSAERETCPSCHGEGTREEPLTQDEFGAWETRTVQCDACHGTGFAGSEEIIHVAGPTLTFGSITRQRCCWCGALIQERDLANISMPESQRKPERQGKPLEADELGWWSGLVAVSGTNPVCLRAVDDPQDGKAPERSCMVLMPEEIERRPA